MANMREVGQIIGEALVSIKARVLALEESEAKPVEPPVVNIAVPEQEPITIDLTALVEAVTNASMGEAVADVAEAVRTSSEASVEAQASFQQVIIDLVGVVTVQQQQIGELIKSVDGMGGQIVDVLSTPKELVLDDDGEPVGVKLAQRQIN